jgi:hypothetical protein
MFAIWTPLPKRIFAEGQARRTRSTSATSAASPVPAPETIRASASPRPPYRERNLRWNNHPKAPRA